MATTQSQLQNFIQSSQGTQSMAQSATPSSANTGNPQTPYNWSSYLPSIQPGQPGGTPTINFDLLTSQAPASSPGYVPPFTADPYAAMLLQGMPRAQENSTVNALLGNLFSGNNPWSGTIGQPGVGVPGPGPGTGPGPGPGTGPGAGTPPPSPIGSGTGRPIGPISGGIDQWIRNPQPGQGVPDTTAPTNLWGRGLSREGALEWLQTGTGQSVGSWLNAHTDAMNEDGGIDRDSSLWQTIWDGIQSIPGQIGDSLRTAWEDATGQNGWQAATGFWATVAGVPGARMLISQLFPEEMVPFELSEETMDNWQEMNGELDAENALDQWERIDQSFMDMIETGGLSEDEIRARFPEYDQDWSQQEWDDMQETMGWNNFWYGSDQANTPTGAWSGTRRPTLGLPALDNMDVFLNQMNADALARSEWFRNMRGTIER